MTMRNTSRAQLQADDMWDSRASGELARGSIPISRTASSEEVRGSRGGWLYSKVVEPLVGMVRSVFTQGLTPELMSLSLAFGVTGGLFPVPGVTTIVCGLFVYLFGLNLAACQLMNVLLTPLDLMMILPFIRMGEWIFFVSEPLPFSADKLATMLSSDFFGSVSALGGSFLRGIVAWGLFTMFLTPILYYVLLPIQRVLVPKLAQMWAPA